MNVTAGQVTYTDFHIFSSFNVAFITQKQNVIDMAIRGILEHRFFLNDVIRYRRYIMK